MYKRLILKKEPHFVVNPYKRVQQNSMHSALLFSQVKYDVAKSVGSQRLLFSCKKREEFDLVAVAAFSLHCRVLSHRVNRTVVKSTSVGITLVSDVLSGPLFGRRTGNSCCRCESVWSVRPSGEQI